MSELAVLVPISVLYQLPLFFIGGGVYFVFSAIFSCIVSVCVFFGFALLQRRLIGDDRNVSAVSSYGLSVFLYVGVPADVKSCVPSLNKGL
jgi:hypothetical protein